MITSKIKAGRFYARKVWLAFSIGLIVVGSMFSASAVGPPVVDGFSPSSGPIGQVVVITGANFVNPLTVTFTGETANTVNSFNPDQITVTVPTGAFTGPITVQTQQGTVITSSNFVITATGGGGGGGGSGGNPAIVMSQPVLVNGQLQLPFAVNNLTNATYELLQTPQLNNPSWTTNASASLSTITPDSSYIFTVGTQGASQFYRVQTP